MLQNLHFHRKYTNSRDLKSPMSLTDFQILSADIVQVKDEQDGMTIAYLRILSALLSLVAVARERDMILHKEAESKTHFVFDRHNYSR